jgi:elongation factor Ts
VVERIVDGRMEKFKDEACLMRQPYIRDEGITMEKLLLQNVASMGENLVVRRFQRWEVGEGTAD